MGIAQATMRRESLDCLLEQSDRGSSSLPASPTATTSPPRRCPEEEEEEKEEEEEECVWAARGSGATSGSALAEPRHGPGSILGHRNGTRDNHLAPWSNVGDALTRGNKSRRRSCQRAESQDTTRFCSLGARTEERSEKSRGELLETALHDRGFSDSESDASTSEDDDDDDDEDDAKEEQEEDCGNGGGSRSSSCRSSSGDDESGWGTDCGEDENRVGALGCEPLVSLRESRLAFEGSPRLPRDWKHGGPWASSPELDRYSGASWSSSSAGASSESSGSSAPSGVSSGSSESSSGTLLSLSRLSRKKRRSKERASFSMWRGRPSGGSKTTDACIQAGDGELLSEKELMGEKTLTDLRWRVRMSRLELGRERFHSEVVKQEQARIRKQLATEYEARIGLLKKQVRDHQLFRDKMLDKLAQCEGDNPGTIGRDPGGNEKGHDATAEVETLRQSNAKLKKELEELRRTFEKQGAVLREGREALAKSERQRCRAMREMEIARKALKMILDPDRVGEGQKAGGENGFMGNPVKVGEGSDAGSGDTGGCDEDGRVDLECGPSLRGVERIVGNGELQAWGGVWESAGRSEVFSGNDAGWEGGGDRGKDVGVGKDGSGCREDAATAGGGSDFGKDSREIP